MKNITDICNANIPNSLHSLYESSLSSNLDESSILGDLNDTLDYGDKYADVYNFINWWIESSSDVYNGSMFDPKYDKKDLIKRLLNVVSYKNGEFSIDIKAANKDNVLFDTFDYTTIYLSKKIGIPSFIKSINFINVGNNSYMDLCSQINDMSKLKITSTGKGKAGLSIKMQNNTTGKITFPVINAINAVVMANTVDSITFSKGTNIEKLELSYCHKLTKIDGDLSSVINFTLPKYFAEEIVKTTLNFSQNSKVTVLL